MKLFRQTPVLVFLPVFLVGIRPQHHHIKLRSKRVRTMVCLVPCSNVHVGMHHGAEHACAHGMLMN